MILQAQILDILRKHDDGHPKSFTRMLVELTDFVTMIRDYAIREAQPIRFKVDEETDNIPATYVPVLTWDKEENMYVEMLTEEKVWITHDYLKETQIEERTHWMPIPPFTASDKLPVSESHESPPPASS